MSLDRRLHIVHDADETVSEESGVKVAFATSDMKHVNQHFGSAKCFAIYRVDPEQTEFIEAAQFGTLDHDGNEDKLAVKFDLLKDCVAVYCQAVGGSAVRQLVAHGIQPVKVSEDSVIKELLMDLQEELSSGPSVWLARAIKQQVGSGLDGNRFEDMADEDWSE